MIYKTVLAVISFSLLAVGSARSQDRGHVGGVLGATFGDASAPLYGAQFGVGLGDAFSIVGGVERLDDLLTGRYALFLREIAASPGVELTGTVPGTYGGAGLRWRFPGRRVSPFLQGELGATRLSSALQVVVDGDDITDEVLGRTEVDGTHLTFALGAGVRVDFAEPFLFEAAFKFFDVLTDEDLSLNRLSFVFGFRF